ncbi:7-cyano-7-deazaguanine synthase [Pseudomonas putida]|uniref:7-cyano-7-deazaguanine synthase n=1 Tax=Pseudomonas putida TaxID=303 RepID=UPI003D345632
MKSRDDWSYSDPTKKHILMLSGGIDSAALAHLCSASSVNVVGALFFDYGHESANRELRASRRISIATNIPFEAVQIPGLKYLYHGLLPGDYHPMMAECRTNDYFVFQSIAASYALLRGVNSILVGAIKEDTKLHPGLKEFLEEFGRSLGKLHGNDFRFITPFIDIPKAEVIRLGMKLGLDFDNTYGCHTGTAIHCGICDGCKKTSNCF